jgi:hypothetical protein
MPNDTVPFDVNRAFELRERASGLIIMAGSYEACGRKFAAMGCPPSVTMTPAGGAAPVAAPPVAPIATVSADIAAAFNLAPSPVVHVINPSVSRTVAAGTVSTIAAERIARHEAVLSELGIDCGRPLYAAGTTVVSAGAAKFRAERIAWERLPDAVDAAAAVADTIKAERRHDRKVRPASLSMDFTGAIIADGERVTLTRHGFRQLLSYYAPVFPRAFDLLVQLPTDVRAEVFNDRIAAAVRAKGEPVTLRCREYGDGIQAFSAVSPSYGAYNADRVMMDAARALEGEGMHGEVVYDPDTTDVTLTASWHADKIVDPSAGDVFKVGAIVSTNDTGSGAIVVDAGAWRNRCLNWIIIGRGTANQARIIHRVGSVSTAAADIRRAVAKVPAMFATFAEEWGAIRAKPYAGVKVGGKALPASPREALVALAAAGDITSGNARDATVEALLTAYRYEPGESLADLVNAITRAAWQSDVDQFQRQRYERAAGELVPVLAKSAAAELLS